MYRIALGDFDFSACKGMQSFQNLLFWSMWFLVVTIAMIVFLNFIIAEVSASYTLISESIDVFVMQERSQLINESEDMMKAMYGKQIQTWNHMFPKYLITREEDA